MPVKPRPAFGIDSDLLECQIHRHAFTHNPSDEWVPRRGLASKTEARQSWICLRCQSIRHDIIDRRTLKRIGAPHYQLSAQYATSLGQTIRKGSTRYQIVRQEFTTRFDQMFQ